MICTVNLTTDEVDTLVLIADYYQKAMGPMRHIVRLTVTGDVRAKYRFISEESKWLKRFAEGQRKDMEEARTMRSEVALTSRALVAFWGRLLTSLNSRRSRRRLSPEELRRREELAAKLEEAARSLERRHPGALQKELLTRRELEAEWIRARLRQD